MSKLARERRAARREQERRADPESFHARATERTVRHWGETGERCLARGDRVGALGAFRSVLGLCDKLPQAMAKPHAVSALHNIGTAHWGAAQYDAAADSWRKALDLDPEHEQSRYMMMFWEFYRGPATPEENWRLHREFSKRIEARHGPVEGGLYGTIRDQSKLRVGFISGDFKGHVLSAFLLPLFENWNRERFELFLYSNTTNPDAVTPLFENLADRFVDIVGKPAAEVVGRIDRDDIDILIDLSGHTSLNRLDVMACHPAPVSATAFGYPASTGMTRIDWRLCDSTTDPVGLPGERLWRIADCFTVYKPPEGMPEPLPPPCTLGRPFTFGSFNIAAKLSPRTLAMWGRILKACPEARLMLKSVGLTDMPSRMWIDRALREAGAKPEQVVVLQQTATAVEHLFAYEHIDLALDPTPYNGTTTTCEALWCGLPVLTLLGDRHSARVSASLISALGEGVADPDMVAESPDDYIRQAVAWATEPRLREKLARLRREQRPAMRLSMLCDGARFARRFDAALLGMWTHHVNGRTPATATAWG